MTANTAIIATIDTCTPAPCVRRANERTFLEPFGGGGPQSSDKMRCQLRVPAAVPRRHESP